MTKKTGTPAGKPMEHDPLFPPCTHELPELTELLEKREDPKTYSALIETICGATDDSQPVEQYDGTLGVTRAFVNRHQRPVGQLQWNDDLDTKYDDPGNVKGARWCSGTLICEDLFLTAGHCFDQDVNGWRVPRDDDTGAAITPEEIALNMHVNFNYQVDPSGNLRAEERFPVVELVEYRLGGLDYAIVRLGGRPGRRFGTTRISADDAEVGDMLCIIGHPAGQPKRIEAGPCTDLHDNRIGYDDIDTLGGNSGSGILRSPDGRIVGVHTNGGCNVDRTGHNHGVRISSIINASPTIQEILESGCRPRPTLKFRDDRPTLKFVDDRPTLKFRDDRPTIKFADDRGTVKVLDDGPPPKSKFRDDVPSLKFSDDGTLKQLEDVKRPGLEKPPLTDRGGFGRGVPGLRGGAGRQRPFAMATPHHSEAWRTAGGTAEAEAYEAALAELEQQMAEAVEAVEEMQAQYEALAAEYQELFGQEG